MIAEPSRKANGKSDRRARPEFIGLCAALHPEPGRQGLATAAAHPARNAQWCSAADAPGRRAGM